MQHPIFDNEGYRRSNRKNFSPMKYISSNLIDTTDMSVPAIMANGQVLQNNTGMHFIQGNGVFETPIMKKGGIHIKKSKEGTFTKKAKSMGMSVKQAASHILSHKENYSPGMVKKANFARNFGGKKQDGGYAGFLNQLKVPNHQSNYGMMPNGQMGLNPNIPNYSQGFFQQGSSYPDLDPSNNPQPMDEYQRGFGVLNKNNILGIGALNFGFQTLANSIDNQRQQDYINQQNDPYSNLVPISGQSQGVKYGYQKYGGFLKRRQYGGDSGDEFDPVSFLWDDDKTSDEVVSDQDVQQAQMLQQQKVMKRQQRYLQNQQAMAIIDAPYVNTTSNNDSTNRTPTSPDSTASYKENIAAGESGGNYLIKNNQPGQTAFGKYQFVKGTRLGVYNQSQLLKDMYKSPQDFEQAFTGQQGLDKAKEAQEATMDEYTKNGESIHKNDPVAMALYHYAPKFAQLYMDGKLDLDKNAADYGIGKGVKNPSFRSFLRTHGFKGQFSNGGVI